MHFFGDISAKIRPKAFDICSLLVITCQILYVPVPEKWEGPDPTWPRPKKNRDPKIIYKKILTLDAVFLT